MRAQCLARIEELLADGPMSAAALFKELGVTRGTVFGYLHYMHKIERTVYPLAEKSGRSKQWALGADPALPNGDDVSAPQRGSAPAQQVGMWRDALVAALFGPAQGIAA